MEPRIEDEQKRKEREEKKGRFIEALKKTYKKQYDAVQPIPYIKDRLYCVDKVYVESGVEACVTQEFKRGKSASWERLESYKSIYSDYRARSQRRILEGEPGYGKSTLTLQIAYDWCNGVWNSPVKDVEVFILLRLRQLRSNLSIFRAIKLFLVQQETRIKTEDIKEILDDSSRVVIILDGYDEYPDRDSYEKTDVSEILQMRLFERFDVSVTSRYLPQLVSDQTKRIRLTGFDDEAREMYIRKAVVGENDEAVREIQQRLRDNSVLADLCQVPLVFVMFAHIAHENRNFQKFNSVTTFFRYMIRCFHQHLINKFPDSDTRQIQLNEQEHGELDEIAYDGLNAVNQQLSWNKSIFLQSVGRSLYEQYRAIGILVEEEVLNDDGWNTITLEVRFYHKLFCEWFAAHYFVKLVSKHGMQGIDQRVLNPFDLQYLYRFACGLNAAAGRKIISDLKSRKGSDRFAILCILEQTGDINDIMESVKELCSRDVDVREDDSNLLQRSTTQLLEIASSNNIPVFRVILNASYKTVADNTILLKSDIPVPVLTTVEKLCIAGEKRKPEKLLQWEVIKVMRYALQSGIFKELSFQDILLPSTLTPNEILLEADSRNINVTWLLCGTTLSMDLKTGQWEMKDFESQRHQLLKMVQFHREENILKHGLNAQILQIAKNYEMPISCLHLDKTFEKMQNDKVTLSSPSMEPYDNIGGNRKSDSIEPISLECGLTVEEIHITQRVDSENEPSVLTTNDVTGLYAFAMKCPCLKLLLFKCSPLPYSFSPGAFPNETTRDKFQVVLRLCETDFRLDIRTGYWELDECKLLQSGDDTCLEIKFDESTEKQMHTLQLLQIAYNYKKPIRSLCLNQSFRECENENIVLQCGLPLPNFVATGRICVVAGRTFVGKPGKLTVDDVVGIYTYGMKSPYLKEIQFEDSILPYDIPPGTLTEAMIFRNIRVYWHLWEKTFCLNLQSGHWEDDESQSNLTALVAQTVRIDKGDPILQQRCILQLLRNASLHNIAIQRIHLTQSVDENFELTCGVVLPELPTLMRLQIQLDETANEPRILKRKELHHLCNYALRSPHMKEIAFDGCLLSFAVYSKEIIKEMDRREVKVVWRRYGYRLNTQNEDWEVDDINVIVRLCSTVIKIGKGDSKTLEKCTMLLLEIASKHEIPINCLHLDRKLDHHSLERMPHNQLPLTGEKRLSCPKSLQKIRMSPIDDKIWIRPVDKVSLTDGMFQRIVTFGLQSTSLKEVHFDDYELPPALGSISLSLRSILSTRHVDIFWSPAWTDQKLHANLQYNIWELHDKGYVSEACSGEIVIDSRKEGHRPTTHLLCTAIIHQIPISCLHIKEDVTSGGIDNLLRECGFSLSYQYLFEKLIVSPNTDHNEHHVVTVERWMHILQFALTSQRLTEIVFNRYVLPTSIPSPIIHGEISQRGVSMLWRGLPKTLQFNCQYGYWEVQDKEYVRKACAELVTIGDSLLEQIFLLQLLHTAKYCNIRISCLHIKTNTPRIEIDSLHLESGLTLSYLQPLEKIIISPSKCNTNVKVTGNAMVFMLQFAMKSERLSEIVFQEYMLPRSIQLSNIHAEALQRKIMVLWCVLDITLRLNCQYGFWEFHNLEYVKNACTETVTIDGSHLNQFLNIQLLHTAHLSQIPISNLHIKENIVSVGQSSMDFESGLSLPYLQSLERILLSPGESDNTDIAVSTDKLVQILHFAFQSQTLTEISLTGYKLPTTISVDNIPAELSRRNILVLWKLFDHILQLNLQHGFWEVQDLAYVRKASSDVITISGDIFQQTFTIQLLYTAILHNISTTRLNIHDCIKSIGDDQMLLTSGECFFCPLSVETISVEETGKEFTGEETRALLKVLQTEFTKKIQFWCCVLPYSIPPAFLPDLLRQRDIKVSCMFNGSLHYLNLQSGGWKHWSGRELMENEYQTSINEFRKKYRESKWQSALRQLNVDDVAIHQPMDYDFAML